MLCRVFISVEDEMRENSKESFSSGVEGFYAMVVLKEIYCVLCVKEKMFKPGVTGGLWYVICILN